MKEEINIRALKVEKNFASYHDVFCHKFRYSHYRNAVCIVTRLGAGQSGVQVPERARDFSLLQNVQTDCGVHPASYSIGKRALVPGVNRLGRET